MTLKYKELIRHKHNKSKKVHFPVEFRYRGKVDSVYITCTCEFVECIPTWWHDSDPGLRDNYPCPWTDVCGNKITWNKLCSAVHTFLDLTHPVELEG